MAPPSHAASINTALCLSAFSRELASLFVLCKYYSVRRADCFVSVPLTAVRGAQNVELSSPWDATLRCCNAEESNTPGFKSCLPGLLHRIDPAHLQPRRGITYISPRCFVGTVGAEADSQRRDKTHQTSEPWLFPCLNCLLLFCFGTSPLSHTWGYATPKRFRAQKKKNDSENRDHLLIRIKTNNFLLNELESLATFCVRLARKSTNSFFYCFFFSLVKR